MKHKDKCKKSEQRDKKTRSTTLFVMQRCLTLVTFSPDQNINSQTELELPTPATIKTKKDKPKHTHTHT